MPTDRQIAMSHAYSDGATVDTVAMMFGTTKSSVYRAFQATGGRPPRKAEWGEGLPGEDWRPVVGYENFYEVSNKGRVRRVADTNGCSPQVIAIEAPTKNRPYPAVRFMVNGRRQRIRLHTVVLTAFVGPRHDGTECRHADGNPLNAELSNLSWGTHVANEGDKLEHGTRLRGSRVSNAKLTEREVVEIKRMLAVGESQQSIADRYGVSQSIVWKIASHKAWTHVEDS